MRSKIRYIKLTSAKLLLKNTGMANFILQYSQIFADKISISYD